MNTKVVALPESTTWPTVIGIIAMAIGGLGILGGIVGTVMVFAVDFFLEIMPEGQGATLETMAENKLLFSGLAFGGLVLASILFTAGLCVFKRSRFAFGLLLTWAVLSMLYTLGRIPVDLMTIGDYFDSVEDGSSTGGQQIALGPAGDILAILFAILPVVFRLAFPIFVMVWLARPKIRREMGSW